MELNVQDTTGLNFNSWPAKVAPLRYETQHSIYQPPTYAVTPQREPLRLPDARMWGREPKGIDGMHDDTKENQFWVEGEERTQVLPETRPDYAVNLISKIQKTLLNKRELNHINAYSIYAIILNTLLTQIYVSGENHVCHYQSIGSRCNKRSTSWIKTCRQPSFSQQR